MRTHPLLAGAVAGLLLAGCATPPNADLEAARSAVAAAKADENVLRFAAGEVQSAQVEVDRADSALAEGADETDVSSIAYVATQRVQAARELARARAAQEQIAASGEARERAVRQSLEQQLAELQAQRTERGLVVNLAGDVLFPVDQAVLSPGGVLSLDRIAQVMRDNPEVTAVIEGHTDSDGGDAYNLDLSERRAEAVRAQLAATGVDPRRLVARGLGETFPEAPNTTAAGKQQNRRVEIVLQDTAGAPPAPLAQSVPGG